MSDHLGSKKDLRKLQYARSLQGFTQSHLMHTLGNFLLPKKLEEILPVVDALHLKSRQKYTPAPLHFKKMQRNKKRDPNLEE